MRRALLILGLLAAGPAAAGDRDGNRDGPLRWAPPPLATPVVVDVTRRFFRAEFGPDEDVLLVMPGYRGPDGHPNPEDGARTADLEITGGRNIRVIGGENGSGRMAFKETRGSVFVEGVSFTLDPGKDAINVGGTAGTGPDVYLQAISVSGVRGSFDTVHADIFQPHGPLGHVRIDRLSGSSDYQGLFLAPQAPVLGADLSRIDLRYEGDAPGPTYLLWFTEAGTPPYPVTLDDVWIKPRAGQSTARDAVWPPAGEDSLGARTDAAGRACWPPDSRITGCVHEGVPPEGRFVPADIGRDYRSPGYQPSP